MDAKDFAEWRAELGLNRSQAAEALGVSRNMPQKYEEGEREIPKYIALACTAVYRRHKPWPEDRRS